MLPSEWDPMAFRRFMRLAESRGCSPLLPGMLPASCAVSKPDDLHPQRDMRGACDVKRIGIIKRGALGDVLRTTALLHPLRQLYPTATVIWITSRQALPLLRDNPAIDRVVVYHPRRVRWLRQALFDLVVSMDDEPTACRLAIALKARTLVGAYRHQQGQDVYTSSSAPWFRMGLLNRDADGGVRTANRLKLANDKTYLRIWLEILGAPDPERAEGREPILTLSLREHRYAERFVAGHRIDPGRGLVGLNPGAGRRWEAKQLSVERAAALARLLREQLGVMTLLLGGPAEQQRNRRILELAKGAAIDGGVTNSLREFAALIGLCRVLVTSDSLALHIGTALKKPVVALFGPTAPQEIELYGRGTKFIPRPSCRCLYQKVCRFRRSCIDRIELPEVARSVAMWLNRKETTRPPGVASEWLGMTEMRQETVCA